MWAVEIQNAKQQLGISEGDLEEEKTNVKHRVNNKIKAWLKEN